MNDPDTRLFHVLTGDDFRRSIALQRARPNRARAQIRLAVARLRFLRLLVSSTRRPSTLAP